MSAWVLTAHPSPSEKKRATKATWLGQQIKLQLTDTAFSPLASLCSGRRRRGRRRSRRRTVALRAARRGPGRRSCRLRRVTAHNLLHGGRYLANGRPLVRVSHHAASHELCKSTKLGCVV